MHSNRLRKLTWFCHLFCKRKMSTLESLKFDNSVLRRLPIDTEERNYVRTVNGACFSKVLPTPVENPKTVAYSASAMSLLDLPEMELERREFAEYFSGNKLLPGSETAAHCYCGHQFGYFSGQLGDGAAIYLGEVINQQNERWEIQLKGAGLTPYSRTADGRKVLRSSIREFLCSEAMHFLGVPTTRAGACITSDSEVVRDIFYDGHPIKEKCTIVLRIAPSFLRFGSFEIFKTMDAVAGRCGPSVGRTEILITMLDYVIETHFPEILQAHPESQTARYTEFFKQVVLSTARLVALWQCVGFCHGVLNTDNMSILGLTLDYGPFGFLDMYDPDHVCNASDDGGRYTFSKQPSICLWNLTKFSEALQRVLPQSVSSPLLELYMEEFKSSYIKKMRGKLGLITLELESDKELIEELLETMEQTGSDFTNTFCCLQLIEAHSEISLEIMEKFLQLCYPLEVLVNAYKPDIQNMQTRMLLMLARSNPEIVQQIGRAGHTITRLLSRSEKAEMLERMTSEEKQNHDHKLWTKWLEKYKSRIEMDKEASDTVSFHEQRVTIMNQSNPRFILRNYIAHSAIEKAEKGDYSEVRHLMKILESPYDQSFSATTASMGSVNLKDDDSMSSTSDCKADARRMFEVFDKPPEWAHDLKVT